MCVELRAADGYVSVRALMQEPQIPKNEAARIRVLQRYDVLDTPPEEVFDRITRIAREVVEAPISLVSLVDEERQWFKSMVGITESQTPRGISFCGHAINSDQPLIVPNTLKDARFADNPLVSGGLGIRFYAGLPLKVSEGVRLGTLCVIDQKARELTLEQVRTLQDLAAMVVRELEFRKIALTDPLTGAFNRRMFAKLGEQEMSRAKRKKEPFCFAMLDLDHFKEVNDRFGHDAGDAVLMQVARSCGEMLRTEDSLFRLGGEEFGVLLGNTDLEAAKSVMERLRENLETQKIHVGDHTVSVTTSIGLAAMDAGDDSLDAVARRADVALFEAKEAGRNCVKAA